MVAEASEPHSLEALLHDEIARAMKLSFLEEITNNFSEENEIGSGAYGVVYKGALPDGFVAVKKFKIHHVIEDKSFRSEVKTLVMLKHTNIVRFLGYCGDTQIQVVGQGSKTILADVPQQLLCYEYLQNGSLGPHLSTEPCGLEWDTCYEIIQGICMGLHYLHENRIIHIDLKPENILLNDEMVPKIADFGLSRLLGEEKSNTSTQNICGTPGYMAPEYIDKGKITFQSDIYSLGVIIREIVAGRWSELTVDDITKVIESWTRRSSQRQTPLEILHQQVKAIKACIEISVRCTDDEPDNRPSTGDIILMLEKTGSAVSSGMKYTPPAGRVCMPSTLCEGSKVVPTPASVLGDVSREITADAKCHMLKSRSLHIEWANKAEYWKWISLPDSRFAECAELLHVYFLAVIGEISPRDLCAYTSYAVYLVYKLASSTSGLKGAMQTSSMRFYGERIITSRSVSLDPNAHGRADVTYPAAREDGWWELKLMEFDNNDKMLAEKAVIVDLREENVSIKKSGLIVGGMEFRPYSVGTN